MTVVACVLPIGLGKQSVQVVHSVVDAQSMHPDVPITHLSALPLIDMSELDACMTDRVRVSAHASHESPSALSSRALAAATASHTAHARMVTAPMRRLCESNNVVTIEQTSL